MSRLLPFLLLLLHGATLLGATATLRVDAPRHAGQVVLLYRYDDLFTLRTVRIGAGILDAKGQATLTVPVEGTAKVRLRIAEEHADLYLRPGADLHVHVLPPDPGTPRGIAGTARMPIELVDIDPLDINALTSDLNEKLDEFILEDLATDQVAGMQAAEIRRSGEESAQETPGERPPTLFVIPNWSELRVDSFELRLKNFYRDIDDPWFMRYLEYGVASMRQGPQVSDKALWERYLKGREIRYDVPEQVRFIRGLFTGPLLSFAMRHHEEATLRALAMPAIDSLKAVFARHDFLRGDDRLAELVALDQLYLHHAHKALRGADVVRLIEATARTSAYPEHRAIAANMHWDLTAMRSGGRFPEMLLEDMRGRGTDLGTLLEGPACVMVTASWCTWCEMELQALAKLHKDHEGIIPVAIISLDGSLDEVKRHRRDLAYEPFQWFHAVAGTQLRDDLRIRSLPAIYLLNDGVLTHAPAPLPSAGLGEIFHRTRVEEEKGRKIKVWDE
ncbi:MAG: hypothetical protein KIT10_14965 [Flavobacteriales bacterium]|nr:hypothetical protein [Flavobacteriales bacterium]